MRWSLFGAKRKKLTCSRCGKNLVTGSEEVGKGQIQIITSDAASQRAMRCQSCGKIICSACSPDEERTLLGEKVNVMVCPHCRGMLSVYNG